MKNYRANLLIQISFWCAGILAGVIGVYITKGAEILQDYYAGLFHDHRFLMLGVTPLGILAATAVAVKLAPMACGSGIPQVLHAATLAQKGNTDPTEQKLVSFWTSAVKVVSAALGFLFGASIGVEGPMVQISTSVFAELASRTKRVLPNIDFQSFIAAGAGTGIAAAFNAPLGGIAFALEEVASSEFGNLRHLVLIAIILSGLTVDSLAGNDLYFGSPILGPYEKNFIAWAVVLGILGGVLGALFGKLVTSDKLRNLGGSWWKKALLFGVFISLLNFFFSGQTAGANYSITRDMLSGLPINMPLLFPIGKLLATGFSTLSGLGGGILAPSLSIGAWMGVSTAHIIALNNIKVCALLGMVAYFSGAFQIPITAVIVVMEITNQHDIIFPMMIAAVVAFVVARIFMPVSLYHLLIEKTFHTPASHLTIEKKLEEAAIHPANAEESPSAH